MQLAINVIIFFLGFSLAALIALRPRKTRNDLENFKSNLRHVTNGLNPGQQLPKEKGPELSEKEDANFAVDDDENLLTV